MIICPRKVWWVVSGDWQTKFNVSPGPGLWSLVLGPDLGPDLDLTWDLDLDLSLTINVSGLMIMISFRKCYGDWWRKVECGVSTVTELSTSDVMILGSTDA